MTEPRKLEFTYLDDSGPGVSSCFLYHQDPKLLAVVMDVHVRGCVIDGDGIIDDIPDVCLSSDNGDGPMSIIAFPELKGWRFWSGTVCKYSVKLCFIKDNE